jgi:hypothetical protein
LDKKPRSDRLKTPYFPGEENLQKGKSSLRTGSVIIGENPITGFCKYFIIFCLVIFELSVAASRVWLGAHTIPQVVLGTGQGLISSFVFIFYARKSITDIILKVVETRYKDSENG